MIFNFLLITFLTDDVPILEREITHWLLSEVKGLTFSPLEK